ncbi:MAG: AMP-binding protein [Myxococcota bacterium]
MADFASGGALPPISPEELPLESLYRRAKERGDEIYMVQPYDGGKTTEYSWKRTLDEAARLASFLKAQGYPEGSRIALVSKNCAHHFLLDLATWMAGHISVSIFPTVSAETLRFTIEHSGSSLLFVGKLDDWPSMQSGVPEGLPMLTCELSPSVPGSITWDSVLKEHEPLSGEPVRAADDLAALVYTSGSTGKPKGVEMSFAALGAPLRAFVIDLDTLSESDRVISYLPLAHIVERTAIEVGSMMLGFRVYFAESLDSFIDDVRRARPTLFISVPRLWLKFKAGVEAKLPPSRLNLLLKIPIVSGAIKRKVLDGLGLADVRYAFTGAAPIPASAIAWYRRLGLELLEAYGMSETAGSAVMNFPGEVRPGSVGRPIRGCDIRIVEQEIQFKCAGLMRGYYQAPELTAEAFTEDGWLRSGDQGEIDDAGILRITGRVKELFKTAKGKYIAPAMIENRLNATELVEQSCVMGRGLGQPFAVVMLNEDAQRDFRSGGVDPIVKELETTYQDINAHLMKHEKLSHVVIAQEPWEIANGKLTPTLKIKRSAIERDFEQFMEDGIPAPSGVLPESRLR